MRRGGRLVIETSNVTIREQDPAYPGVQPGAFVRLSVTDDGIGLTREVQQQIFEPFFSAKQSGKGIGLGLPTVYGIVAQSGGHITVRSEAGKGTTVEILLPGIPRDAA
jgi:signal transduction histidine kinase